MIDPLQRAGGGRLSAELPVLTSAAPGGSEPYIPRFADLHLEGALARSGAVELRGPRGVGKTTTALQKEARHLFWLRDQLGDAFAGGVVLHTGRRPPHPLDDTPTGRIWSAPASALWA